MDPNTQTPQNPTPTPTDQPTELPVPPQSDMASAAPTAGIQAPGIISPQPAVTIEPNTAPVNPATTFSSQTAASSDSAASQPQDPSAPMPTPPAPIASSIQPTLSGPVVGGISQSQYQAQQASASANPFKKLAGSKLTILAIFLAVLLVGGGSTAAYFGFIKDAELKKAMQVSDAFLKAIDEGDEDAAKRSSDLSEDMEIKSGDLKELSEAFSTDLKRYKQDYANKDGKKRAVASYEIRIKFLSSEIIQSWVNLMEKREGKWVVVNMGTVKDKNEVKLADFSDKAFSGEEYIEAGRSGSSSSGDVDTEREVDIKALHGQLEAFYAQNGYYPSLAEMNSSSFLANNMKGLDTEALKDPDGRDAKLGPVPTRNQYAYQVASENNTSCDNVADFCANYILTATKSDGTTYVKEALN